MSALHIFISLDVAKRRKICVTLDNIFTMYLLSFQLRVNPRQSQSWNLYLSTSLCACVTCCFVVRLSLIPYKAVHSCFQVTRLIQSASSVFVFSSALFLSHFQNEGKIRYIVCSNSQGPPQNILRPTENLISLPTYNKR